MQRVLHGLESRGIDLSSLRALELFGGTGVFHTIDYADRVGSLEVWEVDQRLEETLRRNLPGATVRIADSHTEIGQTTERFDLVVVDNPMSIYDGHCEHFDLFPDLFRVAADEAIILLDVIPSVPATARKKYPYLFNHEQIERRREFYDTENADTLSWEKIMSIYRMHADANGFVLEWTFTEKRHFVYYLALKIARGDRA